MRKWIYWIPVIGFIYTIVSMIRYGARAQHPLQGWAFQLTGIMHGVTLVILLFILLVYGF